MPEGWTTGDALENIQDVLNSDNCGNGCMGINGRWMVGIMYHVFISGPDKN